MKKFDSLFTRIMRQKNKIKRSKKKRGKKYLDLLPPLANDMQNYMSNPASADAQAQVPKG